MAASWNFSLRDLQDAEAANIAIAATLKTLLRDFDVDVERVRQLVGSAPRRWRRCRLGGSGHVVRAVDEWAVRRGREKQGDAE